MRSDGVAECAWAFFRLGLTSFGGPVAHLGYFRREFVEKRRWLDESAYADIVALCQFLPGPASSQVAFAIGMLRGGAAGAVAASGGFLLPSAALMIAAAYGARQIAGALGERAAQAAVHGLHLAAAVVVMQATIAMAKTLTPDARRAMLAVVACAVLVLAPFAFVQVAVIAGAMLAGLVLVPEAEATRALPGRWVSRRTGAMCLAMCGVLLVPLVAAARVSERAELQLLAGLYQSGAMVFGGGHVVLPLLQEHVVTHGLVSEQAFLAGYGAVQAMPGPLFSFAAFLGASSELEGRVALGAAWWTGAVSVVVVFMPGWLLVAGAWPFWERLAASPRARRMLAGANAAVVGVLLAALVGTLLPAAVRDWRDGIMIVVGCGALQFSRMPAIVVVFACMAGAMLMQ